MNERSDPGHGGGQGRIAARAQEQQRGEAEEDQRIITVNSFHRQAAGEPKQAPDARGNRCKERATMENASSTKNTEGKRVFVNRINI